MGNETKKELTAEERQEENGKAVAKKLKTITNALYGMAKLLTSEDCNPALKVYAKRQVLRSINAYKKELQPKTKVKKKTLLQKAKEDAAARKQRKAKRAAKAAQDDKSVKAGTSATPTVQSYP